MDHSNKGRDLERLVAVARARGEEYFKVLQQAGEYDFDRVETARVAALQALTDVQKFADVNRVAGVGLAAGKPPAGLESDVERLRKNVEVAQRVMHG